MRKLLAVVMLAPLAVFAACSQDGDDTDPGTDFSLSGTVVEVRDGEEPDGIPDTDSDTDVDAQTGGEADEDAVDPGAIVVESDETIGDCDQGDGYTVYYRGDTAFEPLEQPSDDGFPDSLEDAEVEVTGTYYSTDDENCVFVAETIDVAGESSADEDRPDGQTATFSPGPQPTDAGQPSASPASDEPDEGTAPPDATG